MAITTLVVVAAVVVAATAIIAFVVGVAAYLLLQLNLPYQPPLQMDPFPISTGFSQNRNKSILSVFGEIL